MKSKIGYIIAIILLLLIASAICTSCKTQYVPVKYVHTDVKQVENHDTIIANQRTVNVDVPLPVVKLMNVTKDTISVLQNGLYKSVASIKDGILSHMIETLPGAKLKAKVQVGDTTKIHNSSVKENKSDSIPVPYPVTKYVEKKLSWWQKTIMKVGYVGLVAIVIALVYGCVKFYKKFNIASIISKIIMILLL